MKRPSFLLLMLLSGALSISGFVGCATQPIGDARTSALQNRQERMNSRADSAAERRAIRSENADARSQALFDAM